jgi:hypothetical protein
MKFKKGDKVILEKDKLEYEIIDFKETIIELKKSEGENLSQKDYFYSILSSTGAKIIGIHESELTQAN